MINCNICAGPTKTLTIREQMMGLNESFVYYQCMNCGHTHLESIPQDMSKYYPATAYYSFKVSNNLPAKGIRKLHTFLEKSLLWMNIKKNFLYSPALKSFLSIDKMNKSIRILDYGCGAGQLVKKLIALGFKNAKGFDPYLPRDESYDGELYLTKNLDSLKTDCWEIITLNHVFEHLDHPIEMLKKLNQLLCVDGKLLLRFPVIDSFAFEKYQENWVQFDAPRHLNLFTRKSIQIAVEKAGGYKIVDMHDDSYHFQFTGSELYLKKLSLKPENNNRLKRLLSFDTYKYHFLAQKLNKQNKGDQIVIILKKI